LTYSNNLLKIMGTNIATEIVKTPSRSEHRLYQAVIVQAFEDCLYTLGGKNEAYNKKDAHEWFMGNGSDFKYICDLANLDPDHVHNRYKWCLDNKVIVFTEIQCYWIEYKNEYKKYRSVDSKEERRSIKNRIDQIRFKLQLKDKKKK
jgi:hypothetical protein